MKKFIIVLATLVFISSIVFAQPVLRTFDTDTGGFVFYAIQGPGGSPLPDGNLVQVILDGSDGVMSPASTDAGTLGDPTGDDQLCLNNNFYTFTINGLANTGTAGAFWHTTAFIFEPAVGSPPEPVANCGDDIYLRAWDSATITSTSCYCNSSNMKTGPASGTGPGNMHWAAWDDAPGDWTCLTTGGPYIYLQVEYLDGTACDFGVAGDAGGELDAVVVNNVPQSTSISWPDAALDAWDDTLVVDMDGFASDGDSIHFNVTATGASGQEQNTVGYNVSGSGDQYWTFDNGNGLTLPVELSSFTATYVSDNGTTLLEWTTASETDVQGFNVYRADEDVFENSAQLNASIITGQGTTTEPHDYEFEDLDQLNYNTTYYYWLESIDFDGTNQVYTAIEFDSQEGQGGYDNTFQENRLSSFPNPAINSINIDYAIKGRPQNSPVTVTIYNILGKAVKTQEITVSQNNINISDLKSGIYFYQLKEGGFNQIKKMVIIN